MTGLQAELGTQMTEFEYRTIAEELDLCRRYCQVYKSVGNYGYAIILMTILVRLVFFPLNQYSMKSMGKMRKLGPSLENIKAKYKDDKQQQQKEIRD